METTTAILLTSLQRILAIAIGAFLCYLGYRLFLNVQTKEDSNGKITMPGGLVIHLTRVGPGVFFSLFGTIIIIIFFQKPMEYSELITQHIRADTTEAGRVDTGRTKIDSNAVVMEQNRLPQVSSTEAGPISSSTVSKRIAGGTGEDDQLHDEVKRKTNRTTVEQNIISLNQVAVLISNNLSLDANERRKHLTKIDNIKYSMMKNVWSTEWGQVNDFYSRVIQGNKKFPLNPAAYVFFTSGSEARHD